MTITEEDAEYSEGVLLCPDCGAGPCDDPVRDFDGYEIVVDSGSEEITFGRKIRCMNCGLKTGVKRGVQIDKNTPGAANSK